MKKSLIAFISLALAFLVLNTEVFPQPTATAWKPSRAMVLIVPFGPGGGYDTWGRRIAKTMEKHVGVPVVVKNIQGLGGVSAMETIQRTKPDGHTIILFELYAMLIAQRLLQPSYDIYKFTPVGVVQDIPSALWGATSSPFKSIKDVLTIGKTKTLRGGTTGLSSGLWLYQAVLAAEAKIDIRPVSGYGGGGACLLALEAGDIDLQFVNIIPALPWLKRGTVRALAVGGDSRDPRLPDTPTFAEVGLPKTGDFARGIRTVMGPPGIPSAAAAFLEKSLSATLSDKEFLTWLKKQGDVVTPMTAKQLTVLIGKADKTIEEFLPVLKPWFKK